MVLLWLLFLKGPGVFLPGFSYSVAKVLAFADNLPKVSALELLIAMNSISPEIIVN
jgi:hypothetical protein